MKFPLLLLLLSIVFLANAQVPSADFLGSDTLVCDSSYALLKAKPGYTYLWSTDDTTQTIKAYESGSYWVKITDPFGSSYTDTIDVTIKAEKYKRADIWYFGNGAGVKFDSVTREPAAHNNPLNVEFLGGSSVLADYEGHLQLYTNGTSLYDKNHQLLEDSLAGDSTANQNTVIVPEPNSNRYVYILSIKDGQLSYSKVDMFLNNGKGQVIEKNKLLYSGLDTKITSVKTGDNVWIIAHEKNTNTFVTFKITPEGPPFTPVTSTTGSVPSEDGFLKIDPNGTRIALSSGYTEVFSFNDTTGIVSNPVKLSIPDSYGIEFSQDGGNLFVSTYDSTQIDSVSRAAGGSILKVDLTSSSVDTIYKTDPSSPLTIGMLQLGPDNKLYAVKGDSCISAIDPSAADSAAFTKDGVCMDVRKSNYSLPSFPQHFFKPPTGPGFSGGGACIGSPSNFSGSNPWEAKPYIHLTYEYDFGDGSARAFGKDVQHTYAQPGIYTVVCIITANSCKADTVIQQVPVFPYGNLSPIKDSTVCAGERIVVNALNPGASYRWSTGEQTSAITIAQPGNYAVEVSYGPCIVSKNFKITHRPNPSLNLGTDKTSCIGDVVTLDAVKANVSYQWSNGQSTRTIQPASSGNYWVKISDGKCTASDTILVTYVTKPVAVNFPASLVSCKEKELLDAGNAGYLYQWSTSQTTRTIEVKQSGSYWVEVSNKGCTTRFPVTVTFDRPSVNITGNSTLCEKDHEKQILDAGTGGTYVWSTGETTQTIQVFQPGIYYVTKTFANNCSAKDTITIESECKPVLNVPTAFTPNLDGENDVFKPIAKHIKNYELKIFDRWGEIIYASGNLETGWNGLYKDTPVQPGAYVYTIDYESEENGKKENVKGVVTVFR